MPAWIPDTDDEKGFSRVDVSKAMHAGLLISPLADTIKDTIMWAFDIPADHEWKAGLKAERELELLKHVQ
jgi:2'-hydroxyisoflavone reductase